MRTTLMRIAELAAAHVATLLFANEEETRPVSWRPAGSPGDIVYGRTIISHSLTFPIYSNFYSQKGH